MWQGCLRLSSLATRLRRLDSRLLMCQLTYSKADRWRRVMMLADVDIQAFHVSWSGVAVNLALFVGIPTLAALVLILLALRSTEGLTADLSPHRSLTVYDGNVAQSCSF